MEQGELSVLIGGKAGEGINIAGQIIAQLLARLGMRVCMYYDNPSRIKGGHNFAIIRGVKEAVGCVRDRVDIILAMDQQTIIRHQEKLAPDGVIIFNADVANHPDGIGLAVRDLLLAVQAPQIMANSLIIGAFVRSAGIDPYIADEVIRKANPKETALNLVVAHAGYAESEPRIMTPIYPHPTLPVLTGNEATAIGLVEAGIAWYMAYPMSPTSNLLTFFAHHSTETRVRVLQPESETAALLMALGAAYAGSRAAVGTSGGGFCLMTEALGFSGIAEIPAVVILGQRAGPSTGLATYSAQADLQFALTAGQGEFPRLVVAPGDLAEVRYWSQAIVDLAWKYQLPAILLPDRILCEGVFTLDPASVAPYIVESFPDEPGTDPYLRYAYTPTGVSPMKFPPSPGSVIRINSHVHDTDGITAEEEEITRAMADKRAQKMETLRREIEAMDPVHLGGDPQGTTGLLCWGSNKGICNELGIRLGLRVIQPVVLCPFPRDAIKNAMQGIDRLIAVETNETGQLSRLMREYGYHPDEAILKYDGRPFTLETLESELRKVLS